MAMLTDPLTATDTGQPSAAAFARAYADRLISLLNDLDETQVAAAIDQIWAARESGARIFLVGNGGSAATASHFANDLTVGACGGAKPFRAISLVDNTALLTCLANDFGYPQVFVKQLETQMTPGDVVVALSASGNSENILRAVEFANARGNATIAVVGFDGGRLLRIAGTAVHMRTALGEFGPAEDLHLILDHVITGFLAKRCAAEAAAAARP
ncbi:MAG: SIS domain-containing protein [Acidobacteriota bacterium]